MLNETECAQLTAVAAMSFHHGSYRYICENGVGVFLCHDPVGHVLYEFRRAEPYAA